MTSISQSSNLNNVLFTLLLLALVNNVFAQTETAVTTPLRLPTDRSAYKITLNADGIYELTYAALQSADMPVDAVNPHTFALVYRGEPVAYTLTGDGDTIFEPGEAVQFYGWAFDSSRYEKQFVTDNVFWLWADGSRPLQMERSANADVSGNMQTTTTATITIEPENDFFSTWTDQWASFPNEPDAWYWDRIPRVGIGAPAAPLTYTIPLTSPDTGSGETAVFTAEFTSRAKAPIPNQVAYEVALAFNNRPPVTHSWNGRQNVNISGTLPAAALRDGDNLVTAIVTTTDVLYLNRITVTYPRQLTADHNQIIFTAAAGSQTFQVRGFESVAADELVVWQIGERKRPFMLENPLVTDEGGKTAVQFSGSQLGNGTYIVTTTDNVLHPDIQQTTPTNLNPLQGGADWLAIAHPDLLPAAQQLAAYRASASALSTHVVSITDLIDQYGYGLPLPDAIRLYLADAGTWDTPPRYVVLFGDATLNPRLLECQWSCNGVGWDATEPTLIPTDLRFVDRYQGLIPTDHTFTLLDSDDLLADAAIGRISARTLPEALGIVDKMIEYEQNQADPTQWHQQILFVADDDDAAGAFCARNQSTGQLLPNLPRQHLCLPAGSAASDLADLQAAMYQTLNVNGAWVLNYRGHGSIQYWGGGGLQLLSVAEGNNSLGAWVNDKPTVILSADCLDGHFAWPGVDSISETLLRLPHAGTAAHWSSTGLGLDREHTILHSGFYAGLQQTDTMRIGDAILYAKSVYAQTQMHPSPLYSFTLQGDPALLLSWAAHESIFLPTIMK